MATVTHLKYSSNQLNPKGLCSMGTHQTRIIQQVHICHYHSLQNLIELSNISAALQFPSSSLVVSLLNCRFWFKCERKKNSSDTSFANSKLSFWSSWGMWAHCTGYPKKKKKKNPATIHASLKLHLTRLLYLPTLEIFAKHILAWIFLFFLIYLLFSKK